MTITGTLTNDQGKEVGIKEAIRLVSDDHAPRVCKPGQWRVYRCSLTRQVVVESRRKPKTRYVE